MSDGVVKHHGESNVSMSDTNYGRRFGLATRMTRISARGICRIGRCERANAECFAYVIVLVGNPAVRAASWMLLFNTTKRFCDFAPVSAETIRGPSPIGFSARDALVSSRVHFANEAKRALTAEITRKAGGPLGFRSAKRLIRTDSHSAGETMWKLIRGNCG